MNKLATLAIGLLSLTAQATEFELSGKVGLEGRYFFQSSQWSEQSGTTNLSVFAEPELYWSWHDGDDSITFKPYARADQFDAERSHFDIRELSYIHVGNDWELRAGVRKVYWGVTEFQHLVDVINQTDSVEDIDGEDKLGQQMVNLSLVRDWGIVDLYVLPGFRERTFAGKHGRLRSAFVVDTDNAQYESSAEQNHVDYALRWSHSIGDFDLGSYWFHGTNRDPILMPSTTKQGELTPYYEQMDQFGFDAQATIGDWLYKFETIHRNSTSDSFWALQAGFEYTQVGIFDSVMDLGYLLEYGWDQRGEYAAATNQNDVFIGARLAFNDAPSTEILAGVGADLDHRAQSLVVEASRRLGESYKISLDARLFSTNDIKDILYQIDQDDHLQLTLEKYF